INNAALVPVTPISYRSEVSGNLLKPPQALVLIHGKGFGVAEVEVSGEGGRRGQRVSITRIRPVTDRDLADMGLTREEFRRWLFRWAPARVERYVSSAYVTSASNHTEDGIWHYDEHNVASAF